MSLRVRAKAAHPDTRVNNRRLVLQSLFRANGRSRADLARLTKLSPATVSALVADLCDEGLVEELGRGPAKVGKPTQLVGFNFGSRNTICVDLSGRSLLRAAVIDLHGEVLCRFERGFDSTGRESVVALVEEIVAEAVSVASAPLLGIGVGTPGVVTPDGVVSEATGFDWHGLDLAQRLRDSFGLKVEVANDANTAALAEYSYGAISHNLMVVHIGNGVGAGIVLNGQQYHGENFAAGEIGHIRVEDGGPVCSCGNRGCLETFVSVPLLEAAVAAGEDPHRVAVAAGRRLGIALASAVSLLDIHDIVVSGTGSAVADDLCHAALGSLRERTLRSLGQGVDVRPSKLGDDAILLGAGVLMINRELGVA